MKVLLQTFSFKQTKYIFLQLSGAPTILTEMSFLYFLITEIVICCLKSFWSDGRLSKVFYMDLNSPLFTNKGWVLPATVRRLSSAQREEQNLNLSGNLIIVFIMFISPFRRTILGCFEMDVFCFYAQNEIRHVQYIPKMEDEIFSIKYTKKYPVPNFISSPSGTRLM